MKKERIRAPACIHSPLTIEATKRCLAYESSAGVMTPAYAKMKWKGTE